MFILCFCCLATIVVHTCCLMSVRNDWQFEKKIGLLKRTGVHFSAPTRQLRTSVTPVPGIGCPFLVSAENEAHTWYTDIRASKHSST